jgi:hypothetical protein
MKANRHPVDELADVRAQMRQLKEREDALRRTILAGGCSLVGDEFEAAITKKTANRLDQAAAVRELGMKLLLPFMIRSEITAIRVKER